MNRFSALPIIAAAVIASPSFAATAAADYVAKAGAGDMYELQSSKLVAASTGNADLRRFADQMVTDHGKSTAMVKTAAGKDGMHPKPPVLSAAQKDMLAKLRAARGKARDGLYVTQQKSAHAEALTLHQDFAANGDKPALKSAAGKIVPVVQHHIAMLNGM